MEYKWWQKEIIYQIYPRSFKDSNNDGIGDIQGIISKLPYLSKLGITMIWICPIYKSPMVDNGYDIANYLDINSEFGSMDDLNQLFEEANDFNIKIMLDLVINHTSDEHIWFQEAISNPKSKYRNYYIFKEGINGQPPNNWRSIFGGSVWEKVPNENQYYMHIFDKKQPDLNFENLELRQEIYHMINTWLEKGLAGFRIDSITFLKKDQDFKSLEADGSDGLVTCKHKTRNRPGIDKFLNELKQQTFEKYDCVTVGEAPGVKYNELDNFIGKNGYFSMIFDFKYADIDVESGSDWFKRTNWTVDEFKSLLFKSQEAIQKVGWGANFIENHDQPRAISKLIKDKKYHNYYGGSALGIMYFFLRGTPFIYQGQEIGMTNFERESITQFNDISSIDNYERSLQEGFTPKEALSFVNQRSRDNTRTPMQWNSDIHAGFSDVVPWIELNNNYKDVNVEKQINDENSLFNFYRKMIKLRNDSEYSNALIYGDIHPIWNTSDEVISYYRIFNNLQLQVIVNLSNNEVNQTLGDGNHKVIFNNYKDNNLYEKAISLRPYEAVLLKN
ncbi:alpha-glucosidase [Staphylococcus caledonicus]|uniref:alpha-glucosidase n=1 Tax=Staphylococcus caledonicus TaxID=2741333 RepID=UPI0018E4029E|nr:alpha-glucosidase [Staphylococcus caledonicus]MBI5972981.1 alpha-glucosidase [Staphylococcus caledonicus]